MARERQHFLGELAGCQMSWMARVFSGAKIDPQELNPYRRREPDLPKSPEQIERESKLAWELLDRFFLGQ